MIDAEVEKLTSAVAAAKSKKDNTLLPLLNRDLRYWSARKASAEIMLQSADNHEVRFGAEVTIARDGAEKETFRIVGQDEADPKKGRLSYTSPLAHALMGKSVDDVVTVGHKDIKILKIAKT